MFAQKDEIQEKRLQHQLEMQSMQIEHVFDRHEVDAHVAGGTVKLRHISFNLQTHLATGLERLKMLTDDLMHTLGVPVSLSREDGQFRLHVAQIDTPPVSLLDLMSLLADVPPVTAVLGLAEDGRPVLLDFSEQDMTHIMVSGVSGAGKTALLRSLTISMALMNRQSRVQFVMLDGARNSEKNRATLQGLNYLPHMLANVVGNPNDIHETMAFLMNEVSYRLEYEVKAPTILVMIDEVATLLEMGESLVRDAIRFMAQRGADVGVHLVMSTERPQSAVLDNLLKANISVQIVGQTADSTQAVAVTGLQDSQAEYLLGQGDFLAVAGQYMTHFQAAYIGEYDLHMTLQELHRNRPPALLALAVDDAISLSDPEDETPPDANPQHFVFNGNAISLEHEGLKDLPLTMVVEEIQIEDEAEEALFSVPQPVIHLFHDAKVMYEEEEEDVVEEEEWGWETADSIPHIEPASPGLQRDTEKIYDALGNVQQRIQYDFHVEEQSNQHKLASLPEAQTSEVPVLADSAVYSKATKIELMEPLLDEVETAVPVEDKSENEGAVEVNKVELENPIAETAPDVVTDDEEPQTEYEMFEDDWLPFDDE